MKRSMIIFAALLLVAGVSACSGSGTPAPTAAPAATTVAGPTGAPLAVLTAGNLANLGKEEFASRCSSCHGSGGQGGAAPKLIGSGNALGKYGDAQGILTFVSKNMPKSNPGSLNADQYFRLLAFILVQNNLVNADAPLDSTKLSAIAVK